MLKSPLIDPSPTWSVSSPAAPHTKPVPPTNTFKVSTIIPRPSTDPRVNAGHDASALTRCRPPPKLKLRVISELFRIIRLEKVYERGANFSSCDDGPHEPPPSPLTQPPHDSHPLSYLHSTHHSHRIWPDCSFVFFWH